MVNSKSPRYNPRKAVFVIVSVTIFATIGVCILAWHGDLYRWDDLSSRFYLTAKPQQIPGIEFPTVVNFKWSGSSLDMPYPQSLTFDGYLVTRAGTNGGPYGDRGTITITNLKTKTNYRILNVINDVPGDGFIGWLSVPSKAKTDSEGNPTEFSINVFDLATAREKTLVERYDNDGNPNEPVLATYGREVVLPTLHNTLFIVDVDTKETKEVPMIPGYRLDWEHLVNVGPYIVAIGNSTVPVRTVAGETTRQDVLETYDMRSGETNILYAPQEGVTIDDLRADSTSDIYWEEGCGAVCGPYLYKLKVE